MLRAELEIAGGDLLHRLFDPGGYGRVVWLELVNLASPHVQENQAR